jgi:methylglutaconyl-CoA hydratase
MALPIVLVDPYDPWITAITMNRPEKRNALSVELIEALRDRVMEVSADTEQRVLIIQGAGNVFCAGLDLREAQSADSYRSAEALAALYLAIARSPLVTIAAAQGAALGGGAGIVAACDLAIAADDLRLGYPEARRGLVAALVTCLLRRQLSDRSIREIILTGRVLNAGEALERGLITQVAAPAKLTETAWTVAREICHGAPGAIARTKRLLDDLSARPIEAQIQIALRYHTEARNSAEAAEGIAAFLEKRQPNWPPRIT